MSEITVLVEYNERRKPIVFDSSAGVPALKEAIKGSFSIASESHCLLIQLKNEDWSGLWVDVEDDDEVPDRSLLKVLVSFKVRLKIMMRFRVEAGIMRRLV